MREANFEAHRELVYKEDFPAEHHPVQLGHVKTLKHEDTTPSQNKWKDNKQLQWPSLGFGVPTHIFRISRSEQNC